MTNINKKYQTHEIKNIMTGEHKDISLAVASAYFYFNENPESKKQNKEQNKEIIANINQMAYVLYEKNNIVAESGLLVIPSKEDDKFSVIEIDVPKEHSLYFSVEDISEGLVLINNHNYQEEE